jgi:hypothetical protein
MAGQLRRRIAVAAAALAATGSLALVPTVPAHADVVCRTVENAVQFNGVNSNGGVDREFTLHADRGYHSYQIYYLDGHGRWWVAGYGAEHPNNDGFILLEHTSGC